MKSKLTIFFAGFGLGLLGAFLALGFSDRPMSGKRTRTTLAFEFDSNGSAPVEMKRIVR